MSAYVQKYNLLTERLAFFVLLRKMRYLCLLFVCCFHLKAQLLPLATHKDVGQISEDSLQLVYEFVIRNETASPLQIDTVHSDCACVLLRWPKEPISPQAEALLQVRYDLRGQLGSFEKKFRVEGNQGSYQQTFTLGGEVVPGRSQAAALYAFRKESLQLLSEVLHFGTIVDEEPVYKYFFAYNRGEDTLVFRATELPTHLQLRFLPEQLPPGEVARWQLYYDPKKRSVPGYQLDELLVYAVEGETVVPIKCFVAATTVGGSGSDRDLAPLQDESLPEVFSVEQRVVNLGRVHPEEALVASFAFKNTGRGNLHITEVRTACSYASVQSYRKIYKPEESGEIAIIVDASQLSGQQICHIEVHTNDARASVQLLKLRFFVKKK